MLTSNNSNQYLRPEYLSPLPTTLDAKKSPLALLAQTCSQIGADPPVIPSANKSSLLNGTSSSHNNNHETHSSLSAKSKSSGSHHTKSLHQDSQPTNRKLRSTSSSPPVSEKNLKKSHHPNKKNLTEGDPPVPSPVTSSHLENNDKIPSNNNPSSKASSPNPTNPSPPSSSSSSSSSNPTNKSPPTSSTAPAADSILSTKSFGPVSEALATSTPSILPPTSTHKLNLSALNFSSASSIDLALKHGLPFPGLYPPASTGTGIPAYLHSYARLKAAAANGINSELNSGCRDPFCTGCHLGPHGLNFGGLKGTCPAGCLQCDHNKSPFGSFPFLPGLPMPPSLGNLYASSNSSLQPYVCNWFVGESYCGKRFSSSDELLHHLRSHTSLGNSSNQEAVQNLAAAALAAGYPPSGFFSPPSQHPLLASSQGLLSRTYPTPPLSPLLGSGRFHPYAKGNTNALNQSSLSSISSPSVTSSFFPPGFPIGHPAFSHYYPYSLYGQRL